MTNARQYREHIKCTFNAFCKIMFYHAVLDAYQKLQRKQQLEVSLDDLRKFHFEPAATDKYFVKYKE